MFPAETNDIICIIHSGPRVGTLPRRTATMRVTESGESAESKCRQHYDGKIRNAFGRLTGTFCQMYYFTHLEEFHGPEFEPEKLEGSGSKQEIALSEVRSGTKRGTTVSLHFVPPESEHRPTRDIRRSTLGVQAPFCSEPSSTSRP